jgi:hypothetical protein
MKNAVKISVGKPQGKTLFGKPMSKPDDIPMDVEEMGYDMD